MPDTERLRLLEEEGWSALRDGACERARELFSASLSDAETAEGWEGLSWAAWWLDDAQACLAARERAYRLHQASGDRRGAGRMALWLGDDHDVFRGDSAVANGWLRRAERLLEDLDPGPEHVWLAFFRAYATLQAGDMTGAKDLCAQAQELILQVGTTDLELLGLAVEGLALVEEGLVEQGMSRLDEAAAVALAGECEEHAGAAYACCMVVWACDRVHDIDRAAQWCGRAEEYGRRLGIRFLHASCQASYGSVLVWKGDWAAAERVLEMAIGELAARPAHYREAVARLGELRRRQGRIEEAEGLLVEAEFDPLARLGLAEMAIERGDLDTARMHLERALRSMPAHRGSEPVRSVEAVRPLELMVRVETEAGNLGAAEERLRELDGIVSTVPLAWSRATCDFAKGVFARAVGDPEAARRSFEDAVEQFTASGAPFETARARLELARTLWGLGHGEAARREAVAASRGFGELGAVAECSRAERLLEELNSELGVRNAQEGIPLTARQLEVLTLIARGHGDRKIASELVVSEHTVHRHVSNILTRLGCSSRAAAVAEAARRGLLDARE